MELDSAAQLAFGTASQQEIICKAQLPQELDGADLICKCIGGPNDGSNSERLEAFELLANIFYPGAKWASVPMIRAVELDLKDMIHVIDSWGSANVTTRLASLRRQPKSKQGTKVGKALAGGDVSKLESSCPLDGRATKLCGCRCIVRVGRIYG